MRELKLIEFKLNGPRTHSSLVKDMRLGHMALSGSPNAIDYIFLMLRKKKKEFYFWSILVGNN